MHILIIGDVDSVKDYMDFSKNNYSIITSEYEYNFMPSSIKYAANVIYTVKTPEYFDATCFENSMEQILLYVAKIVERFGEINSVVATHEHTVLPAAIIRTYYNIDGLQESQARSLRDKNIMKSKIRNYGIFTPNFTYLKEDSYESKIKEFLKEFSKVVLKPADQAGSNGIFITSNVKDAIKHAEKLLKESKKVSLEQYIDLPVMHFDGVAYDGEVIFLSVIKKIGNCYNFVHNRMSLASIIINDKQVYDRAKEYVEKCLSALNIKSLIFHLEVFVKDIKDYIFLEIAGRYPGAGITNLIKRVFDFDLVKASYDLDCHLPIEVGYRESEINNITPTAMLLIPSPVKKSILVRGISGMDHLPDNIIGSEFYGPGTLVTYSSIDAFKPLARIYISDSNVTNIESTISQITSQINFRYEEV